MLDGGDIGNGKLHNYIKENYPESSTKIGFIVAVPKSVDGRSNKLVMQEIENPTSLGDIKDFKLLNINCSQALLAKRDKSLIELMFCMLRAKHNFTNGGM